MEQRYTIKISVVEVDTWGRDVRDVYPIMLNHASTDQHSLVKFADILVEMAEDCWHFDPATDSERLPE